MNNPLDNLECPKDEPLNNSNGLSLAQQEKTSNDNPIVLLSPVSSKPDPKLTRSSTNDEITKRRPGGLHTTSKNSKRKTTLPLPKRSHSKKDLEKRHSAPLIEFSQ